MIFVRRVRPYLRHQTGKTGELHIIKEVAEEDRESWRVVKLTLSDKVRVLNPKLLADVEKSRSLCQLSSSGHPPQQLRTRVFRHV
jgi:hypothetical protein